MNQTINISSSTIWRAIFIVIFILLLYFVRDILILVFTSLILAAALDRPIDRLQKHKIPRALSAILIYVIALSVSGLIIYLIVPPLVSEVKAFASNYSFYLDKISDWSKNTASIDFSGLLKDLPGQLAGGVQPVLTVISNIFGGFVSFIVIFFLALFFNIQENGVKKFIYYLTPNKNREYILELFGKIQQKMSAWLWGKILIAFSLAILTSAGLYFMGIKYALTLGVLAGLLNFIPYIGVIIAAIPAIFLGLVESPLMALIVAAFYTFLNAVVESFFLTPLLMRKVTGLNAGLLILVVLIGAKLAGVLGIILAIPTAVIVSVLIDEYIRGKQVVGKETEL
ncbi:MAG: AI-2E family transporter [Candidatus Portnoybacteria bacterium]|nr:AI-2E family transporter [Candidatus Portnoybacteria bacterium]